MFTEKELQVIKQAKKKIKNARVIQAVAILELVLMIIGVFANQISGNNFVALALVLALLTVAQPELGSGPKYKDLVELLERKK